ncbi:MAG: PQQ-dependent sugar dehydrogenase [Bryobacterales bacterium]|nr:PQQ-dependent sugar dehydrogenase [Bryobacterales bacterium]
MKQSKFVIPSLLAPLFLVFPGTIAAQDSPETVRRGTKIFEKRVVAAGLENPWEVTWGPDGFLWVTERTGKRITRVHPGTGQRQTAAVIDEVFAPGGQDGLLGMALHPDLLKDSPNQFVYAFYTYVDQSRAPWKKVADPSSPYHRLYAKVVRFRYDKASGKLGERKDLITGLPAGNDHEAGRIKVGPGGKLYFTIGDQGHNQLGNFCLPIEAQRLPTAAELQGKDYSSYVGKSLRMNLDGSIPDDNPKLNGVVSHVYTYGHRNPQGLDFAPDGTLYSNEHGPKTDDEVNILKRGGNYGWPHVAGVRDGKAYQYARWAEASTPCSQLKFSDLEIHAAVPREPETAFRKPFVPPIATMFTVATGFNFQDPVCEGVHYICWPTVGPSSIEYYESKGKGIPGWDQVLLVTTLKRGSLYVAPLRRDGQAVADKFQRYFQQENRFRDTAVDPDLRTIYIATDSGGLVEAMGGGVTTKMQDSGAILAYRYQREGTAADLPQITQTRRGGAGAQAANVTGKEPSFTAGQAAAGKTAYNASCAVCHGSTLANGTFGTPLAGRYFKGKWTGKTVQALVEKSNAMPPGAPANLPAETMANIIAYVLETNGAKAGTASLPPSGGALSEMVIR